MVPINGLKITSLPLLLVVFGVVFHHCESESQNFLGPRRYPSSPLTVTTTSHSLEPLSGRYDLDNPTDQGVKAAYWPSFDEFPASSIDTTYFTHIYYAFVLPDPVSYELTIGSFEQEKIPEFMNALQSRNPPVKTLLSIGGGGNDPAVFSRMASNESTRANFIESTIKVSRTYGFDGLDLDWEFPSTQKDMSNLALLYKQWQQALIKEAKTSGKRCLLLTSAVYYASIYNGFSYPGDAMGKYLDWVSPMCFDYHGSWEKTTGEHSALFDLHGDLSTSYGIGSWIQAGVPPEKIVMGLPLYGHTWKLQDPKVNGIGAPAVSVGPGDGELSYSQILDFNSKNNATVRFDSPTTAFYAYAGDNWIGYDDVRSIQLKIRFAHTRALGGYFFWALGMDKNWTLSRQASREWGHQ